MSFGWQEVILIILVILLVFGGAKKLPQFARSLGKAMKEFKKAVKDVKEDVSIGLDDEDDADSDAEKRESSVAHTGESKQDGSASNDK